MDTSKKYFKINKRANTMLCMQCGKYLCGIRVNNMKRHLQAVHSINIDCKRYKNDASDDELVENAEPIIEKQSNQHIVSVDVDKNKFLKCCVGLLAVEDYPLRIFDDKEYFKPLISPFERKYKTDLNSENMKTTLEFCSTKIKTILSKRIKGNLISIRLDMATKKGARTLDITIQFITQDFKIQTSSLGLLQLQKNISSSCLKEEILRCLKNFKFHIRQIYSITTDGSSVVVEASKLLRELQEHQFVKQLRKENSSSDESLDEENGRLAILPVLSNIPCAAHLIQMTANDVLETLEVNLNNCRNIVRKIRAYLQNREHELKIPALDDITSWISTYEMLKSLIKIKEFIDTEYFQSCDSHFGLNWEFVKDFLTSFEPLANCTVKLLSKQYIIGDLYRDWLECELELEELSGTTTYASQLQLAMEQRKAVLLQNNLFLAALYLDPRFNFQNSVMLTKEQKDVALEHLLKVFEVMTNLKSLKQQEPTSANPVDPSELDEEMPSSSGSAYSRLEERMNSMMAVSPTTTIAATKRDIKQKLTLLTKNSYKVSLNTDVLNYWKISSFDNDLKKLAQVVLAIPVTRVSDESASNSVDSTIAKFKSKLSSQTLNSLILTKLNYKVIKSPFTKIEFALDLD